MSPFAIARKNTSTLRDSFLAYLDGRKWTVAELQAWCSTNSLPYQSVADAFDWLDQLESGE